MKRDFVMLPRFTIWKVIMKKKFCNEIMKKQICGVIMKRNYVNIN